MCVCRILSVYGLWTVHLLEVLCIYTDDKFLFSRGVPSSQNSLVNVCVNPGEVGIQLPKGP